MVGRVKYENIHLLFRRVSSFVLLYSLNGHIDKWGGGGNVIRKAQTPVRTLYFY